jgi:nucleoside 2-deoxyribosyltransferase
MKAYLASDLGFTEAGGNYMYKVLIPALERAGAQVINPWDLTDPSLMKNAMMVNDPVERVTEIRRVNKIIAGNNTIGLKESDILIAVLDGTGVDDGVAAEIGYSFASGKRIYGLRTDFRLSSDNEGSAVNLQIEYFIEESGGSIEHTVDDLISRISL